MGEVDNIKKFSTLNELLQDLDREGIYGSSRSKAVDYFFNLKARNEGIPFSGGFELTPLCNFDCKMCYVHLNKDQMGSRHLLTIEQWKNIMDQAIDAGMVQADLTGGECLTYPGFKEIYLFLLSKGIRVSILTNGYLLNQNMVDFLSQYRPEGIQISLYGSSDQSYESVTGVKAYTHVIENIERLKKAGIRVNLTIMTTRYMIDDAFKMLDVANLLNVDYNFGPLQLEPRPETGRRLSDFEADADVYLKMVRYFDEHYSSSQESEPKEEYIFTINDLIEKTGPPCSSGKSSFHVNWKGELTPCIPYYAVCESILDSSFQIAWERIQLKMKEFKPPAECEKCKFKKYCVTCPAEKTFGILNGPLNKAVCKRVERMYSFPNSVVK